MTEHVVVIGAGGFGRETLDVLRAIEQDVPGSIVIDGVVDSSPHASSLTSLERNEVVYLGTVEAWLSSRPTASYLVAVGDPAARKRLADDAERLGLKAATAIHPRAGIGSDTSLGEGTIVCAGAEVSTGVHLGRHVHVNPNATIGHDAHIADFVSVNPAAVVSGFVSIASETLIGAGAVVLQGLTVGGHAIVGAASCVTRDVAPGTVVKGVPAR